jgi:hypothetical protein
MNSNVKRAVVAVLLAGTSIVVGNPASAAPARPAGFQLNPNTQLAAGQRLTSRNGQNTLEMQADGNLVEYVPGHVAVWSTETSIPHSVFKAQSDGNFVIVAPGNQPMWDTGTAGHPGAVLQLQNDRNVVAYATGHVAIWESNTN